MPDVYEKNGSLLADGASLRGCCCPSLCKTLYFDFRYRFPNGIPVPENPTGEHHVEASCSGYTVQATSQTWNSGWGGQDDRYWDEGGCTQFLGAGSTSGPGAYIQSYLSVGKTGYFGFSDTRRGTDTWSVALVAEVRVKSDYGLGLRANGSTYRPPDNMNWSNWLQIGAWMKTNTNTVSHTYNFSIVN